MVLSHLRIGGRERGRRKRGNDDDREKLGHTNSSCTAGARGTGSRQNDVMVDGREVGTQQDESIGKEEKKRRVQGLTDPALPFFPSSKALTGGCAYCLVTDAISPVVSVLPSLSVFWKDIHTQTTNDRLCRTNARVGTDFLRWTAETELETLGRRLGPRTPAGVGVG